MEKYARTKDGIFELTGSWGFLDWAIEQIINNEKAYETVQSPHFVKGSDIIKEADTVEKLLDQVVAVDSHGCTPAVLGRFLGDFCLDNWIEDNNGRYQFFGAIWTDKGLIYVAKMNEDGEFELI